MYYLVYGFLRLLSFIPLPLLYLLGDFVYALLFYVVGYRKQVVMQHLSIAYWTNFFSKPAPFPRGPEEEAIYNNTAIVYVDFYKVKRGYYAFHMELLTSEPNSFREGELTRLIVDKIEASIRQRPANYLWSHRRWKHEWEEEYRKMWIE